MCVWLRVSDHKYTVFNHAFRQSTYSLRNENKVLYARIPQDFV